LDEISSEIELSASDSFGKDEPTSVHTPYTFIPPIQKNPSTYFPLSSLFYKSPSPPPILGSKKPTIKIEEEEDVDSNVEIQSLSPQ